MRALSRAVTALGVALILCIPTGRAETQRTIVFISDLHMGLGRDASGAWFPTEDFRWPASLEGFLEHISRTGNNAVDLVMVGDILELWQPPPDVACEGPGADYGCSVTEMTAITRTVIAGHRRELAALAAFARRGKNCVHVIPGNHDAALVIDAVWSLLKEALQSEEACVTRAADGVWVSEDGRVVAEHGHQIGWDPNRFGEWPAITRDFDGEVYLRRPWGEQFVQKVFNDVEAGYPLIDNLSPLSAGVKYRIGEQGVRATAVDIARFLKFHLLETSVRQRIQVLGERDREAPPEWDVEGARALGYALLAGAFASDDDLEGTLFTGSGGVLLRDQLDRLSRDETQLSDDAVRSLCDQRAARSADPPCPTAERSTLGGLAEAKIFSRERVVGPYVEKRWQSLPDMRVFVYGHTHAFEAEWQVPISSRVSVSVLNDGAFQRVIDDAKFRAAARARGISPSEALRDLGLESLPACYTFVKVHDAPSGELMRELAAWHMQEDGPGVEVDVCDPRCADVGHGCL